MRKFIAYLGLLALFFSGALSAYQAWQDVSWPPIVSGLSIVVSIVAYFLQSPVFSSPGIIDIDSGSVALRQVSTNGIDIRDGDLALAAEIVLTNRGDPLHDISITPRGRFHVTLERADSHTSSVPVQFLDTGESADLVVAPCRTDDQKTEFTIAARTKNGPAKLRGSFDTKSGTLTWR